MFYLWRSLTQVTLRCLAVGIILECRNQWGLWKILPVARSPAEGTQPVLRPLQWWANLQGQPLQHLRSPSRDNLTPLEFSVAFVLSSVPLGGTPGNLMGAVCQAQATSMAQTDHDGPSSRQSAMIHRMTGLNGQRECLCVGREHSVWDADESATSPPNKAEPMGRSVFTKTHSVHCSLCPS